MQVRASTSLRDPRETTWTWVLGVCLGLKALFLVWSAQNLRPQADGVYYEQLAKAIVDGHGYSLVLGDHMTPVCHFPPGYSFMLAAAFWVFGASHVAAMLLHFALGLVGIWSAFQLAPSRLQALWATTALTLHPTLFLYSAAWMTDENVGLLLLGALGVIAHAQRARPLWTHLVALFLVLAITVLARPQTFVIVVALAIWLASSKKFVLAAVAVVGSLAPAIAWTIRNHLVFGGFAFVGANAGWNLLIGTSREAHGVFLPLEKVGIPEACRTVWDELKKDQCFANEARKWIFLHPIEWFTLMPRKLYATFDLGGAAASHLEIESPTARLAIGFADSLANRALVWMLWVRLLPRKTSLFWRLSHWLVIVPGALWVSCICLIAKSIVTASRWRQMLWVAMTTTCLATIVTHAVFFGGARYMIATIPLMIAAVFLSVPSSTMRDESPAEKSH